MDSRGCEKGGGREGPLPSRECIGQAIPDDVQAGIDSQFFLDDVAQAQIGRAPHQPTRQQGIDYRGVSQQQQEAALFQRLPILDLQANTEQFPRPREESQQPAYLQAIVGFPTGLAMAEGPPPETEGECQPQHFAEHQPSERASAK